MANAKIFEGKVRVESTLTTEQIRKAKALKPDALKIKDDEGNETFIVTTVNSANNTAVSTNGVALYKGKAVANLQSVGSISQEHKWELEAILINLDKVEKQVAAIQYATVDIEDLDAVESEEQ